MTTSPNTPLAANFPLPTSPANHTPKEPLYLEKQVSSSASPSHAYRPSSDDPENPPVQAPASPRELHWSPSHPCYPHPNPHVPFNDRRRETTRVIRVQRDYSESGDLYPQFSDTYPEIVAQWISEREFRTLVTDLNAACRTAFRPNSFRAFFDTCMGLATGWLWEDLGLAGGKAGARRCEDIITRWNRDRQRRLQSERAVGTSANGDDDEEIVMCVSLRRTAWLCLDFIIPDPRVAVVRDDQAVAAIERSRRTTPRASTERIRAELEREREQFGKSRPGTGVKQGAGDGAAPSTSAGRPEPLTLDTSVGKKSSVKRQAAGGAQNEHREPPLPRSNANQIDIQTPTGAVGVAV